MSLQDASTRAGVTTTTGRVFELGGKSAISDPVKRAACVKVWSSFETTSPIGSGRAA